jgi:predicted ATP-grasp superfamily ATP-dependent carboligase
MNNINTLNNKISFILFITANELDYLIPKTYYIFKNYIKTEYNCIVYPCIYKADIGSGGHGHVVAETNIHVQYKSDYLVQEFILDGDEYSSDFYVLDGTIISHIYYKDTSQRESKLAILRGALTYKQKINDIALCIKFNTELNKIFNKLNYTGFACADFKLFNDQIKIFEINPRLGGTLVSDKCEFENFLIDTIKHLLI